jgi:hypothetical protein
MRVTNANFVKDQNFRLRCEIARVEPTKRQASKFRRGIGRAAKVSQSKVNQVIINMSWREN